MKENGTLDRDKEIISENNTNNRSEAKDNTLSQLSIFSNILQYLVIYLFHVI